MKKPLLQIVLFWLLGLVMALGLTGCNFFGGIDKPSGDAQLISAGISCLDQGNFQCAITDFQGVSSANNDIAQSNLAFAGLDQGGATMGTFAGAFGNGSSVNIGTAFTSMANSILISGPGTAARVAIFNGFMGFQNITDNTSLSGLVQFLGAVAFASEILAEVPTAGSATLTTAEINANDGGTKTVPCNGLAAAKLETVSASTIAAGPTYDLFNSALLDIQAGLGKLAATGNFANTFNSVFSNPLIAPALTAGCVSNAAYNTALTGIGIGTN